jgi:hypothetical protein
MSLRALYCLSAYSTTLLRAPLLCLGVTLLLATAIVTAAWTTLMTFLSMYVPVVLTVGMEWD